MTPDEFVPDEIDMPDPDCISPRPSDDEIQQWYDQANKERGRHGLHPLINPHSTSGEGDGK